MTQAKHTPTPWVLHDPHEHYFDGYIQVGYVDEGCFKAVCEIQDHAEEKENAAFIVTAVNSHYEILNALKTLRHTATNPYPKGDDLSDALAIVDAAIAKAEGGAK